MKVSGWSKIIHHDFRERNTFIARADNPNLLAALNEQTSVVSQSHAESVNSRVVCLLYYVILL